MKYRWLAVSFLFLMLFLSGTALSKSKAGTVIIDAADGNTQADVQAVIDAYPTDTRFLLRGTFAFSGHVHLEKSGTHILGEWVDTNGNGQPDEGDDWPTTINALPNVIGKAEAFSLMPADEVSSMGYDVSDIEISGIHLAGFNRPIVVFNRPSYDQVGCRDTPLPYALSDVYLANNWVEGGSIWIYRKSEQITIHNNLFTIFENSELELHAIQMRGVTDSGCDLPFSRDVSFQDGLSITDNVFTGARDISVGFQRDLRIEGNVFSGNQPSGNPTNRLWISQASGALVKDNVFMGEAVNSGVFFWTRSNLSGVPGITSTAVLFIDNTFVDNERGIYILGGTDGTTIKDNAFYRSGAFGPAGGIPILASDVAFIGDELVTRPSKNLSIKHNHISGAAITGVLLNGETTGVKVDNNTFDNPYAPFGDVALADQDVLYGWGDALCPAHGNKVISDLPNTAVVFNGYSDRCEGRNNNKVLGDGALEITP